MCLTQEQQQTTDKTPALHNADIPIPVSPWGRLFRQVAKPKLKHTTKINLNKYWSKFGELMSSPTKTKNVIAKSSPTQIRAKKQLTFDGVISNHAPNEENEKNNMIKHNFVLAEDEEINENIANEIREMWSYQSTKCQICHVT